MPGSENTARQRLIDFLLDPSSYPHRPSGVTHLQTHISDIFIAAPYVYKVKKPVNLGFLDFSTLEKRKHFCSAEVELNRRLCPGAYLGVEVITFRDRALSIGGAAPARGEAPQIRAAPGNAALPTSMRGGGT